MKGIMKSHVINYCMTFSPCQNYIAISNNFNSIMILNLSDVLEKGLIQCSSNITGHVYNLKSCDDLLICTSDCCIIAWSWSEIKNNLINGCKNVANLWKLNLPFDSEFVGCLQIISMYINEINKTIYVGCSDGLIHIWQISNEGPAIYIKSYSTTNGSVLSLTNIKGYSFISGHTDGTMNLWDDRQDKVCLKIETQNCPEVARPKLGNCVNVIATDIESSDWILSGGHGNLALWNVRAGRVGVVMKTGIKDIDDSWIPFTAIMQNDLVISGGNSSKLFLWDVSGQLNSEINLGGSSNVYDLLHREKNGFKDVNDYNDFFVCGWGSCVELYSDIGYRKKILTL